MNGRLFESLPSLAAVNLLRCNCTNEVFMSKQIPTLSNTVTEQCGFNEVGNPDFKKIFNIDCGTVAATGYVIGGTQVKPGQWPFLAALVLKDSNKFFCGGNIITKRHVLTAAHCVHEKYGRHLEASDISVMVGRHSLKATNESESEVKDVLELFVHPEWNSTALKYDADLAILLLSDEMTFSRLIRPVCLADDIELMNAEDGFVAGWGKGSSEELHEDIPKQALIRAVNASFCFDNEHSLGHIFSRRSFCAKGQGTGPCRGDSGGGFYVKFGGLWTIRGLVSAGKSRSFRKFR